MNSQGYLVSQPSQGDRQASPFEHLSQAMTRNLGSGGESRHESAGRQSFVSSGLGEIRDYTPAIPKITYPKLNASVINYGERDQKTLKSSVSAPRFSLQSMKSKN